MTRRVGDFMARQVHCVGPDTPVSEVVADMCRINIGAVMVVRDGEPVGIFTERDLLKRVVGVGLDPKTAPISVAMTAKVMSVSPEATVEVVAILMHKRGFRHMPVMDNGALVGILSVRDVLRALAPEGGVRPSGVGLPPPRKPDAGDDPA